MFFGFVHPIKRKAVIMNNILILNLDFLEICKLNSYFVSRGIAGKFVIARPKIIRRTRDVIFVEGSLLHGNNEFYFARGIWKIVQASSR